MSTKNKNKKLAYKMGQLLAKLVIFTTYLLALYVILADFNIFKIDLCTNTIDKWIELVLFNNLFVWNL